MSDSDSSAFNSGPGQVEKAAGEWTELKPRVNRDGVITFNPAKLGFSLRTSDITLEKIRQLEVQQWRAWLKVKDAIFR